MYPLLPAARPGDRPSTSAKPIDEDGDGIEKLETKIEGGKKGEEMKELNESIDALHLTV